VRPVTVVMDHVPAETRTRWVFTEDQAPGARDAQATVVVHISECLRS
jgi:hypothetical protein